MTLDFTGLHRLARDESSCPKGDRGKMCDEENQIEGNGGTALVIHAKAEDVKTDPTGNGSDSNRMCCDYENEDAGLRVSDRAPVPLSVTNPPTTLVHVGAKISRRTNELSDQDYP